MRWGLFNRHHAKPQVFFFFSRAYLWGNQQGFTLLELIIVCLLITVSLAFSVPNFRQSLVVDQLAASSRKVIALIKEVRTKASQEQQAYLILVDLDQEKISFQADLPASKQDKDRMASRPTIKLSPSVRFQDIQSGSTERKISGEVTLWVNKHGYMDQTIFHLSDDQDHVMSIVLSPFLPTIKAHDSYIGLE